MATSQKPLDDMALVRVLRLNAIVQGVAAGLVAGLVLFIATNWLVLKGGSIVGPHLSLLGELFIGYRVTFVGSLIGFVYAFGCGFIAGYVVSGMYNRIVVHREQRMRALDDSRR